MQEIKIYKTKSSKKGEARTFPYGLKGYSGHREIEHC
jgi:hypothetical protein